MSSKRNRNNSKPMLFTALNYKLIGVGVLMIIAGFTAMRLENEVYGVISLYFSPVVILSGYVVVMYAILKRDHKLDDSSPKTSS